MMARWSGSSSITPPTPSEIMVSSSKTLKEQNRTQLYLFLAFNILVFYGVIQMEAFLLSNVKNAAVGAAQLVPAGLAIVLTIVFNGVLSSRAKERLVFMRWRHALPGHRAFSKYAPADPRIDLDQLRGAIGRPFPTEPAEQNKTWYKLYSTVKDDPSVTQVHRDFLLTRDCAGFAAIFMLVLAPAALILTTSKATGLIYCVCLAAQFLVIRHAASTYGARLVANAMARASSRRPEQHAS
jgi:hypothetical protein